ncbi:hypothetical protein [Streptomyces sp. NBC_00687]|uniref:hypothetical protein n=1 Tax=Streptomyces sp. NBC_00687 TaxID=2975807 RepID=UPI002253B0F9|nr:hypothetical protein [Streptomyces sp. NBC_00687]MCX4912783.1 hypothetical protein [Streptomyces sp. NBC_00687]
MRVCGWCDRQTDSPVKVAGKPAGHDVFACPSCRTLWGLLPYEEHPAGSDGSVVYDSRDLPFS